MLRCKHDQEWQEACRRRRKGRIHQTWVAKKDDKVSRKRHLRAAPWGGNRLAPRMDDRPLLIGFLRRFKRNLVDCINAARIVHSATERYRDSTQVYRA